MILASGIAILLFIMASIIDGSHILGTEINTRIGIVLSTSVVAGAIVGIAWVFDCYDVKKKPKELKH